jgi:hypothetical protein
VPVSFRCADSRPTLLAFAALFSHKEQRRLITQVLPAMWKDQGSPLRRRHAAWTAHRPPNWEFVVPPCAHATRGSNRPRKMRDRVFILILLVSVCSLSLAQGGLELATTTGSWTSTSTAYSTCTSFNGDTYIMARDGIYKVRETVVLLKRVMFSGQRAATCVQPLPYRFMCSACFAVACRK